jgi:hypothetical protein
MHDQFLKQRMYIKFLENMDAVSQDLATSHKPIMHYALLHNYGEESTILDKMLVLSSISESQYSTQGQIIAE